LVTVDSWVDVQLCSVGSIPTRITWLNPGCCLLAIMGSISLYVATVDNSVVLNDSSPLMVPTPLRLVLDGFHKDGEAVR
jgi:hypothetical protein